MMNAVDENGRIVPDTEALEQLINCGYICTADYYVTDPHMLTGVIESGKVKYTYTSTPAFKALCALYELQLDARIRQNPAVLYDGENPVTASERQKLLTDMIKSSVLMEMVIRHPVVEGDSESTVKFKFLPDAEAPHTI